MSRRPIFRPKGENSSAIRLHAIICSKNRHGDLLFCLHTSFMILDGSIGTWGVGRPREEVHSDHSLMIKDELLDGSAHSGSISFGNSL